MDILTFQFPLSKEEKQIQDQIKKLFQYLKEDEELDQNVFTIPISIQVEDLTNKKKKEIDFRTFISQESFMEISWHNFLLQQNEYEDFIKKNKTILQSLCYLLHIFPFDKESYKIMNWGTKSSTQFCVEQFTFFTLINELTFSFIDEVLEKKSEVKRLFFIQCLITLWLYVRTETISEFLKNLSQNILISNPILSLEHYIRNVRSETSLSGSFERLKVILDQSQMNKSKHEIQENDYDLFNNWGLEKIIVFKEDSDLCLTFYQGLYFPIHMHIPLLIPKLFFKENTDHLLIAVKLANPGSVITEAHVDDLKVVLETISVYKMSPLRFTSIDYTITDEKLETYLLKSKELRLLKAQVHFFFSNHKDVKIYFFFLGLKHVEKNKSFFFFRKILQENMH